MDFTKIFDFGGKFPEGAKYAAALVFVLILILFVSWLLKKVTAKVRIGGRRGGRLKVQESIMVDANRVLTLVRCDNVEHLILLGGTNDLVVASNIQKPHTADKNAPLTVALAPTVQTPALQPMAAEPVRTAPPLHTGMPIHQDPPAQAAHPAPAAPQNIPQQPANPMPNVPHPTHYKPPQQAAMQPLPTPAPRSASPQQPSPSQVSSSPHSEPAPESRPSPADTGQINVETSHAPENSNSPSLSNIRPGDEK